MPEKRRNKNKNKRKNKNNRPDASHTNTNNHVKEKNTEKCNDQADIDINNDLKKSDEVISVNQNTREQCVIEIPDASGINCLSPNVQISNQDLNNNSNVSTEQALTDLVQTLGVPALIDDEPPPLIIDVTDACVEAQLNEAYIVESPEQSIKTKSSKSKLTVSIKSKSLDNEDEPKIVEITEDIPTRSDEEGALAIIDTNNVIVSDIESDFEWEKADELNSAEVTPLNEATTGTVSITAVPLNMAQCHQTKPLTPEMEISLRNYLKTLDLSTNPENIESVEIKAEIEQIINREIKHRLRKKAQADDFNLQRLGPPRMLDVIDEEGSSESSMTSRRQSYLSDKKSDIDDLDDDVFEDVNKASAISQKVASSFPKKTFGRLVPQQCVLVGAKIKDLDVTEARGDWTMSTVEKMTGAEVVYLTDTSSSSSSLHDLEDENDDGVETDVSVRMITPTIEVTDTENLLKNTFMPVTEVESLDSQREIEKNNISQKIKYEENPHEIVVLSTDDIKTNLYVKEIPIPNLDVINDVKKIETISNDKLSTDINTNQNDVYDLEMKVLKCELNNAINNLIKEVSDSELNENSPATYSRQDSSSSVCSSQCTAKYNPTHSSLNDVSNTVYDEVSGNNKLNVDSTETSTATSHVKEVFEHVTGATTTNKEIVQRNSQPLFLRDICVKRIAKFPFGDKILEELASVSERLQNIATRGFVSTENSTTFENCNKESSCYTNMPYFPLPDLSSIEKVILPSNFKDSVPPPVQPRHSSLKREKSREEDVWTGIPTKNEPVYVCLSPSQKMLMEKTNTLPTKDDATELANTHKNYVERRGYNECFSKQNQKDKPGENVTPIVPFKSQTGSRLLALIRDPKLTNSISSINKHCSSENIENIRATKNFSNRNNNRIGVSSDTFRPIPPPRPKKMSSFYESDESSDFTDSSLRSMKSERKFFHYSTGNLSKEIEDDVSSIQQMHRNYTNTRDKLNDNGPRRPSLPKDLCDQQMEYIRQKEKEVEAEIQRLEAQSNKVSSSTETKFTKAPFVTEKEFVTEKYKDSNNYFISKQRDFFSSSQNFGKPERTEKGRLHSVFSRSQEELLREKMYSEYVTQMAEREERKQHKVIKITNNPVLSSTTISKSMPVLDILDSKVNNRIEKEFICKARERWDKLGIKDPETEDERDSAKSNVYREPKVIEHKIKVIEGENEREIRNLPRHLQEFVRFTANDKKKADSSETVMIAPTFKARSTSPAVWRPGAPTPPPAPADRSPGAPRPPPPPPPPVWTPGSAGSSPQAPRKPYRPVHFEDTTPPPRRKFANAEQNGCTSGSESESRLRTSQSAPVTGLNSLGSTVTSRLPRAQNPTVTLLQKAREGQIPRGSSYLQQEKDIARLPRDRPSPPRGDPVHALRREYASETEGERSDQERASRKMADAPKKIEGIGPITKEGMPVSLRSEVKDPSKWYKKMYDTIHKNKYDDDYVTIRYKSRRGQEPERVSGNRSQYAYFDPRSGYLSEPEGGLGRLGSSTWSDAYDSDVTTGTRRRTASVQEERRMNEPYTPSNKYSTLASARASQEMYNKPGRIENYTPGRSSVVDKEAKQQNVSSTTSLPQASPKEKKDLTSAILSKSNMARALKESGYESDSTLVFRRREETDGPLSPAERRAAYRDLQAGGEPPIRGFRSPAPPRQETDSAPEPPRRTSHGSYSDTESPRRYVESDVNIHYRCPVRQDPLPLVPERELARQQAEHMKRLYREQRRNKYLQELQDMQNRRHQDNFTPSQKNILPLNRYDEAEKVVAKALYTFNGQTNRELSFRKGEIIHVRRQVDANWYEGELHGRVGLFPYNYVEIQKGDNPAPQKKPIAFEGKARAKFDFTAQTNLELPLKKGEIVVLTRRIDQNWWEGRNGNKMGIFPDSYVTILQEPSQNKPDPQLIMNHSNSTKDKPVASPASHSLMNGTAKRSIGPHSYTPQHNSQALSNAPPATQPLPGYASKTAQPLLTPSERGYGPPTGQGVDLNNTEPLYVDTNAEAIPYRAMYKYRPQNPDELELNEGDTVYVLEKCDDGWYVGSSQRTGRFGTFPGNYVERI